MNIAIARGRQGGIELFLRGKKGEKGGVEKNKEEGKGMGRK